MAEILKLKKSNCKNCHKCIRTCPVKSIRFSGGQANIIGDACILCGNCFVVCPQHAKQISSDREKVEVLLASEEVYASLAPSFVAAFPGIGIRGMEKALKQLGFSGVEETAIGATIVKREYERILLEERPQVLISSCCSTVNLFIQIYHPQSLPYLAEVTTPLMAHCKEIKRTHPAAKTVFIGPCISKKKEAEDSDGLINAVLTFEDLKEWLQERGIQLENNKEEIKTGRTRMFPVTNGVIDSMDRISGYTYFAVDGLKNCDEILKEVEKGELDHCFIEMNSCEGGCVNGPLLAAKENTPLKNYIAVMNYAGRGDFEIAQPNQKDCQRRFSALNVENMPSEKEIHDTLLRMGKKSPADYLNCGSCGYDSCREKAIAVIQGKAEISMCLPYMMERTQSFSRMVVTHSPNAIIVFNEKQEIQEVNPSACRLLNVRDSSILLGENINRIMDSEILERSRKGAAPYWEKKYLPEFECYVEQTIIYVADYKYYICVMKDITDEMRQKTQKRKTREEAVRIADQMAQKQLAIVQEIASLLGETAADTLGALEHLKETIEDE